MMTRSKRNTLGSKNSKNNQEHKGMEEITKTTENRKNSMLNEVKSPYIDEKGIIRNFAFSGRLKLCRMSDEANYNHYFYNETQSLKPIPFIIDIPEGMPCYIRSIEDIVNLTEEQVNIFLKGYACNIKGSLERKKYELARNLGVPWDLAKETFNYDPSSEKLSYGKDVKSWVDENGLIRNFIYYGSTGFNLWQMGRDAQINHYFYNEKQSLIPIPFVIDIPEGMPCYIRSIEDIVNLTEDQVNIFLKGYACNIKGPVDKRKYELARNLGVPWDLARETFNYDPSWANSSSSAFIAF
jgi:hypothetical protein